MGPEAARLLSRGREVIWLHHSSRARPWLAELTTGADHLAKELSCVPASPSGTLPQSV